MEMRASVRDVFVRFTSQFEGVVPFMYLDVKGLVTTAIGNLIDPVSLATACPFVTTDGRPATAAEIEAEWMTVKAHPTAARQGHRVLERCTRLRLTPEGIEQVVSRKREEMLVLLRERFPGFDEWPADAQLATLSMAWACGPAFRFPRLARALRAQDFFVAAEECRIDERNNAGVVPRNEANRTLYRNAAMVIETGLDPDTLYWPQHLT